MADPDVGKIYKLVFKDYRDYHEEITSNFGAKEKPLHARSY
jgi:hypothetical protein